MKIAEDLQKYIDENIEDIATNHIEAYKDRYIGYTVDKLETDLSINYDDSFARITFWTFMHPV